MAKKRSLEEAELDTRPSVAMSFFSMEEQEWMRNHQINRTLQQGLFLAREADRAWYEELRVHLDTSEPKRDVNRWLSCSIKRKFEQPAACSQSVSSVSFVQHYTKIS
jgi:hypothetical protein